VPLCKSAGILGKSVFWPFSSPSSASFAFRTRFFPFFSTIPMTNRFSFFTLVCRMKLEQLFKAMCSSENFLLFFLPPFPFPRAPQYRYQSIGRVRFLPGPYHATLRKCVTSNLASFLTCPFDFFDTILRSTDRSAGIPAARPLSRRRHFLKEVTGVPLSSPKALRPFLLLQSVFFCLTRTVPSCGHSLKPVRMFPPSLSIREWHGF